jgi:GTP pyrophosphokinase
VVEDTKATIDDLPVDDEIKEIVRLLTHAKTTDENRDEVMAAYYEEMMANPKAVLVKCMDRCHNLSTMAGGLSYDRIIRMIRETEQYYPDLLDALKETIEYSHASWLLKYQIESMLDIYKRLL